MLAYPRLANLDRCINETKAESGHNIAGKFGDLKFLDRVRRPPSVVAIFEIIGRLVPLERPDLGDVGITGLHDSDRLRRAARLQVTEPVACRGQGLVEAL